MAFFDSIILHEKNLALPLEAYYFVFISSPLEPKPHSVFSTGE